MKTPPAYHGRVTRTVTLAAFCCFELLATPAANPREAGNTSAPAVVLTAVCDNTGTSDATSCLNNAIAAASGLRIRIPSGIYQTGRINIPGNVSLACDAGARLIRNAAIPSGHGWIDIGLLGALDVAGDGVSVTQTAGDDFSSLQAGDRIYVDGVLKTVSAVTDATHLTINPTTGGLLRNAGYVAPRTDVTIDGCLFDGQVTIPAGYDRALLTTPLIPAFTDNSTVWLHGGVNITFRNSTIQHTAGYAAIVDAGAADVRNVSMSGLVLQDNRPFLFGDAARESQIYGAWPGSILACSDGSKFNIQDFSVVDSTFQRQSGHGIFWYVGGTSKLNTHITHSGNHFAVMGLDGILKSGIDGYTEEGNTFERIGFVPMSDSDSKGTPRWYNGPAGTSIPAVASDTASVVINAIVKGNTAHLVNGGCFDLDGLGYSTVEGNQCSNPMPGDSDYDAMLASRMGPAVYGGVTTLGQSYAYGINTGNTNNTSQGAANLVIRNNSMRGLGGGSIRIYAGRNVQVTGNQIIAAADSNTTSDHNFVSPVVIGNIGTGPNQRANGVTVTMNKIEYAGSTMIFAVGEDAQYGAFSPTDINRVYGNELKGNLLPFQQDSSSGSLPY